MDSRIVCGMEQNVAESVTILYIWVMCVDHVALQAAGAHSVSGISGVIHLLFILLLAPHERQLVTVAPSVITCFSVFLYFFLCVFLH